MYASKETEQAINSTGEIIFVESIGDLLNLNQHGFKNVLVTFGLDISTKLICATLSLNIKRVIISLNNDKSSLENRGLNASIKNYLKLLNYYNPDKMAICLPTEKDFGDMSSKSFTDWSQKLDRVKPEEQQKFILEKINKIYKILPKSLLKNKKIITDE